MAHSFTTNLVPTAPQAMYAVLTTLLAAGWTKIADSDGTTYSSSGAQITGSNSGTHGLDNNNAWFVVRDPNGVRSFCCQATTNRQYWRIKYSASAGFSGGSPSATQVPSATDEQTVWGSGTDASPAYAALFTTNNTYVFNMIACDASLGYSFIMWTFVTGNAEAPVSSWLLDILQSGSYPSTDIDPAVVYLSVGGTTILDSDYGSVTLGPKGWSKLAGSSQWITTPSFYAVDSSSAYAFASQTVVSRGSGTNPFTSSDDSVPCIYARASADASGGAYGWKGFGSLVRHALVWRSNMSTFTVNTTRDYVYFQAHVFPWDGSQPSI